MGGFFSLDGLLWLESFPLSKPSGTETLISTCNFTNFPANVLYILFAMFSFTSNQERLRQPIVQNTYQNVQKRPTEGF